MAQDERKATKECYKMFLIKEQRELSQLNEAFFSSDIYNRDDKVKKLNNFNNQPEVPLGQSLGRKPPQSEP